MPSLRYDVVVVGARVAGAATARLLARQGRRVLLLDRARPGTDTLSTHAILRAGVLQLHRWGLLDRVIAAGTPPIRRTTFSYGDAQHVVDLAPADGIDALYAPRRTVLDPILVEAAVESGVEARFRTSVTGLRRDGDGRVRGVEGRRPDGRPFAVHADLVVGADGASSRIAQLVDAPIVHRGTAAGMAVYTYLEGLETDGNEWHYAPGCAAGVIPTNDARACVFVGAAPAADHDEHRRALADRQHTFDRLLGRVSPVLAERVRRATRVEPFRAFPGRVGFLRHAHGPGWALVGDAAYFKDPITAHGMSDALRDAELLARAVARDDLAGYQTTRDAVSLELFSITDAIATYAWDLDEVRAHLLALSRSMQAEVDLVRAWTDEGGRPDQAAA